MQFDADEVMTLLNIIEKEVAVTGGRLAHIKSEAFSRLNAIEEGLANAKRKQQGLPLEENAMVASARMGAKDIPGTDPDPTPSKPLELPESKVAEQSENYQPEEPLKGPPDEPKTNTDTNLAEPVRRL